MAKSNEVMSEPFSMSAVLTPLLGWRVDRSGGRATLGQVFGDYEGHRLPAKVDRIQC